MSDGMLPKRVNWLFKGFSRYVLRYLRKHFHAVRLSASGSQLPNDGEPILIVANHPSWWDPMVGMPLVLTLKNYRSYAPIHSAMLEKYPIFGKLGFFGVDPNSLRSAAEFLSTGEAILAEPRRALWVTTGPSHAKPSVSSWRRIASAAPGMTLGWSRSSMRKSHLPPA